MTEEEMQKLSAILIPVCAAAIDAAPAITAVLMELKNKSASPADDFKRKMN